MQSGHNNQEVKLSADQHHFEVIDQPVVEFSGVA
jgi:hypothetical protein